jgi:hypothetical protein
MTPNPLHRLPAPLETAVQRLKLAAREAAERTIESLGLAALAANNAFQRDGLLGAQFELNRKSAIFALTFNDAYDQRVLREVSPREPESPAADLKNPLRAVAPPAHSAAPTDWASLSLVEDKEVEAQISADRFGMEIQHSCEWELRELEAYVGSLLREAGGMHSELGDRNPLRPELIGFAMIRGINAISDREDVHKVLSVELARSLGGLLRTAYGEIVAGLRNAGVQPLSLTVRHRSQRAAAGESAEDSEWEGAPTEQAAEYAGRAGANSRSGHSSGHGGGIDSRYGARRSGPGAFAPSQRGNLGGAGNSGRGSNSGHKLGPLDPALATLIRRLNYSEGGGLGRGSYDDGYGYDDDHAPGAPMPPNVIRANREALRRASTGALDHMVIDVIGFMFDQILADPNVPPQLARQIARLQLPVLRAALGDQTFFSSRRHPVRRFINRIASLGSAFEDFGDEAAKQFLNKVRMLVQEVAEGDFDHIEIYEQKLAALETFTQNMAKEGDMGQREAASLLSEKEDQQRLRDLYALRLAGELKDLGAPLFLREFLANVWSQVLMRAAEQGGAEGANSPLAQRLRAVARELFLSVQPKATAAHRKAFLAELPKLMQELTAGMNLIQWPEEQRRAFFGQLMPAHAEALKTVTGRTLEINLMARQIDGALQRPPPSRADLPAAPLPTAETAAPQLTADEARRVGMVQESAIDWSKPVAGVATDHSATADAAAAATRAAPPAPPTPGFPEQSEAPEPTEGRALADHVQMGYPYQMHIEGEWQKVRLSHVSAARSFFIFTHGAKNRQTISLTLRMLIKLCETGRLKAYETAYLVERATARARRQLAELAAH